MDEDYLLKMLSGLFSKMRLPYLVSEDKDLTQEATAFELYKRLWVLISGTFLREVMGWTSEQLEVVRKRT